MNDAVTNTLWGQNITIDNAGSIHLGVVESSSSASTRCSQGEWSSIDNSRCVGHGDCCLRCLVNHQVARQGLCCVVGVCDTSDNNNTGAHAGGGHDRRCDRTRTTRRGITECTSSTTSRGGEGEVTAVDRRECTGP